MMLPLVPVREINETGEELCCADCGRAFNENEEAVYWIDDYCCEACAAELAEEQEHEAELFAKENCKITKSLPRYDPKEEFRCTPEEYAAGSRESYSRNSHLCYCRHNCTNYGELIRTLDKHNLEDQIS